ncbi:MAG: transposase family protein, partial [Planctomycetota bacterium]|nr:transposase family protein [Planctomycetota bacterium]
SGLGYVEGLRQCLADVKDPRVVPRCDHQLLDIVAVALLAVMCGAEDWPDVEEFGESRRDWLKTFLELPGGIPSHDTFRRVFGRLDRWIEDRCLPYYDNDQPRKQRSLPPIAKFCDEHTGSDPSDDPQALRELLGKCEKTKMSLSKMETARLRVAHPGCAFLWLYTCYNS